MKARLADPIESLIQDALPESSGNAKPFAVFDVAIVGSGYGGAMAAARLAGPGRDVLVLERGREYAPGDFPEGMGELPRHVRFRRESDEQPIGYADGLFDFRSFAEVDILVGNGLGGTSLINANVAVEPDPEVFRHAAWPASIRNSPGVLGEHFSAVRKLLKVTDSPPAAKTAALEKLAIAIGATCAAAPVAVTFGAPGTRSKNHVGVTQPACTMCGNCVSGCNVGAKNTLAMNALPLAVARGAKLFTGATVISVIRNTDADTRGNYPWALRLRRTASEKTPLEGEVFHLAARDVILAAGTLGSTEILLRSGGKGKLALSAMLGMRFSGNGDAIASGYAQEKPVRAMGTAGQQGGPHGVGPTITAIARKELEDECGKHAFAIEDGAVPAALRGLFGEIVTTAALMQRVGNGKLPAWFESHAPRDADPIAVADGALEHTQVLLMMGDDGAPGRLRLRDSRSPNDATAADFRHVVVEWSDANANAALKRADELLAKEDRGLGFDDGQYLPNPTWRAVPEMAVAILSGGAPGGRMTTVHPLGGCVMGEDARSGVVDHLGRVFDPDNPGLPHDGLHVLDGSILPKALGINPFLTIAALSWRAAGELLLARDWKESEIDTAPDFLAGLAQETPAPRPAAGGVKLTIRERLVGSIFSVPPWLQRMGPDPQDQDVLRLGKRDGLILCVDMTTPGNLEEWLKNPTRVALDATAKVYINPIPPDVIERTHIFGVPDEHLLHIAPLAIGEGKIRLLEPVDAGFLVRGWRTLMAVVAFLHRRKGMWRVALELVMGWLEKRLWPSVPGRPRKPSPGILKMWGVLWSIAKMHGGHRRMRYDLDFSCHHPGDPEDVRRKAFKLEGEKILAWYPGTPRLWDSLLALPFALCEPSGAGRVRGSVEVDTDFLFGRGAPRVEESPHLPATVEGMARFAMVFVRAILQTHLWDFGAPEYPKKPVERPAGPPPLRFGRLAVFPEVTELSVPAWGVHELPGEEEGPGSEWVEYGGKPERRPMKSHDESTCLRILLTRYAQPQPGAEPVLLVHGLAQGSLIFTTDTLDTNMAAAMWKAGYDVWVVDYRLSNMLPPQAPTNGWSMEEMAGFDIPAAVGHVYRATGNQPVRIFAHCVGATAVAMGTLAGWLDPRMVRCIAFNAIHPWIIASPVNRFRALLGTFFRDVLGSAPLNPIPTPTPSALESMMDRAAFSFARYGEEANDRHFQTRKAELAEAVCDRMSLLYGRMWRHENLDPRTHLAFPLLVGPAPGDVYRHLYYLVSRQRITDRDGVNAFLTEDNLRTRWTSPTLFLHGEKSEVFNPHSATRSAVRLNVAVNLVLPPGRKPIPIGVKRIADFGHMDVVFSREAADQVFPHLIQFFRNPDGAATDFPWDCEDDTHPGMENRLTAGPILRAAWVEGGGVRIRIWAETNDESTTPAAGLSLVGNGATKLADWNVPRTEPRYFLLDATVSSQGPVGYVVKAGLKSSQEEQGETPEARNPLPWLEHVRLGLDGKPCSAMRFLVGSCRYPGSPFERVAADAIFGGMMPHVTGEPDAGSGVHLAFFIGDQIYSDATAGLLDTKAWRERFGQRYRDAFTSQNAKALLASVPTHFAIDDHEIGDDWSGEPTLSPPNPPSTMTRRALRSARSFQSSGRESRPLPGEHAPRTGTALWYPLSDTAERCCPAFVMDTRSERALRWGAGGTSARFVSEAQEKALSAWLAYAAEKRADMPKFIFCGVGIAPIDRELALCPDTWRSSDGWLGYPDALVKVARQIIAGKIRNVVFVSGDLHLSAVSKLLLKDGDDQMLAWNIVSSGLYSPMPFANADPRDYDWNEPVEVKAHGTSVAVEATSGWLFSGDPHFLRVDAENAGAGWKIEIAAVDKDGKRIPAKGKPPAGAEQTPDGTWTITLA